MHDGLARRQLIRLVAAMNDHVALQALGHEPSASPLIRGAARLLSVYDRAPPRMLYDMELSFIFDSLLVWAGRKLLFAAAGRAADRAARQVKASDISHSGWPGTVLWLAAWIPVIWLAAILLPMP